MKKLLYYFIIPFLIFFSIIFVTKQFFHIRDYEKMFSVSLVIISTLSIIIGGFWGYRKFGWEKRCEHIITLKSALMGYSFQHSLSAAQFRKDNDIIQYKIRLQDGYNTLQEHIHLSYYVPKKVRDDIFQTIWLTIGNDHGQHLEKLDANWSKFGEKLDKIFKEFDNLVDI